jgi:hypothetical protein
MVVIAMHYIDKLLGSFTVGNGVKGKTMHQIFEKSPEKSSGSEGEKYPDIAEIQLKMSEIDKINNHRHIHPPNNQRMGFGEHFHICVAEQLGLPFIMNLFKLHITGFMPRKYIKTCKKPCGFGGGSPLAETGNLNKNQSFRLYALSFTLWA